MGWLKVDNAIAVKNAAITAAAVRFSVAYLGKDPQLRQQALRLYVEGLGFRAIGRLLQVSNVTVLKWVRPAGQQLENRLAESAEQPRSIPVVEIDERSAAAVTHLHWTKKNAYWVWMAVPGTVERAGHQILEVVAGGRDTSAGQLLWSLLVHHRIQAVKTDYYPVYPLVIPDALLEQSKKQTYTVEGYNSLLRHYLARLKRGAAPRKTKCYSKCLEMLFLSLLLVVERINSSLSIQS